MRRSTLLVVPILLIVLAAACTSAPKGADAVLAGARRAMGVTDSIKTLDVFANVTSPGGSFETRVASSSAGHMRISIGKDLIGGINLGAGWRCDSLGKLVDLDTLTRSVIRGHDLHMITLAPHVWLKSPTLRPCLTQCGDDSVMTVEFKDELGGPLLVYYRATDTLPIGLDVVNHTGNGEPRVEVYLSAWDEKGAPRFFRNARFQKGVNKFDYDYREVKLNTLQDSAFDASCR